MPDVAFDLSRAIWTTYGPYGLAAAAVGVLFYRAARKAGAKWVDERFDRKMTDYKHDQQKELEQIKSDITAASNRGSKVLEKEFEILPELWSRFWEAYIRSASIIDPAQRYDDVGRLTKDELNAFLKDSKLSEFEKNKIIDADDVTETYRDVYDRNRLANAYEAFRKYKNFLSKNGVLIDPECKIKFDEADEIIWSALKEYEYNKYVGLIPFKFEARDRLGESGKALIEELELIVQRRLWGPGAFR